ncbi:hypothetical protein [Candidatus Electrothrix sp.]|uniref:hypothetical protein n=1 Tax=Candidatus Electrothrix sp. TaxID=2170559 RepID=UPI004055C06F
MSQDPLVDEVRRQRAEILKSYDWDVERMSRDVMQRQWQSGQRVVSRAQDGEFMELMDQLSHVRASGPYSRDEMNER